MTANGHCSYVFNPSEIYQKTKPGMGVETTCGALTWPAADEPEVVARAVRQPGIAEVTYQYLHTGRMLPREHPDPYCPAHGGSPEPPPPPVTMDELEAAHTWYAQLAARFQAESGAIPVAVPAPAQISPAMATAPAPVTPAPVTLAELHAAADHYEQLAAQAGQDPIAGVSGEQ